MLKKISIFFLYAAIASPLVVTHGLFYPFIAAKGLFFRECVELALAAFVCAYAFGQVEKNRVRALLREPLFIAVLVFTALFLITNLHAINPSFAFWANFERGEGGWQILHYFFFFALLAALLRTEKEWRRIIGWQVVVASAVALYAMGQALKWPAWIIVPPLHKELSGTLGNSSYLGGYLLLSIGLALFLTLSRTEGLALSHGASLKHRLISYGWLFLGLFQCIFLVLSKTRASFIALACGAIAFLFIYMRRSNAFKKWHVIAGALILCAFLGAGTLYLVATVHKANTATASMESRLSTWGSAISGVIEKPLFGWGAEHFPFAFDAYYPPIKYGFESWYDRPHSAFLDYAVGGGIPLLIAYLAIFYILMRKLTAMQGKAAAWGIIAVIPAVYLMNNAVLFETLPIYLIIFLLLAFYIHYTKGFALFNNDSQGIILQSPHRALLATGTLVVLAASLYFAFYLPLEKNKLIIAAIKKEKKVSLHGALAGYEAALSFYAPMGQQEVMQNLFEFINDRLDDLNDAETKKLMGFGKKWYGKTRTRLIGVKSLYTYAKAVLTAAEKTGDEAYLREARALVNEGSARAPLRIEFIKLAMRLARLEGDASSYARAREKGKLLRPDLRWND